MDSSEMKLLREKYHVAIQAHEDAVKDFLSLRNEQASARMSETYEHADILREQLRRLSVKSRNGLG